MRSKVCALVLATLLVGAVLVVGPVRDAGAQTFPSPNQCASGNQVVNALTGSMTLTADYLVKRAQWLAANECLPTSTIGFTVIGNALDCRLTLSTLPTDAENQLTALGKLINFLNPLGEADTGWQIGDWTVPWTTVQRNNTAYAIANCDLQPQLAAALSPYVRPRFVTLNLSTGTSNSVSAGVQCTALTDAPSGNWKYSGSRTWFPPFTGPGYKFGCPIYRSGGDADSWVQNDFKLCQVNMSLSYIPSSSTAPEFLQLRKGQGAGGVDGTNCNGNSPDVGSEPGTCCTFPNFGVNDPVPPWSGRLGTCEGLTITSEDRSEIYYVVGDSVTFTLSPVDAARPPGPQVFPVRVVMNSGLGTPRGSEPNYQETIRPALGEFTMTVPRDGDRLDMPDVEPRVLDYITFHLFCADGSSQLVFYDPSGQGGSRRTTPGRRTPLEDCLAAIDISGVEPSTWVPALTARLKCLVDWLITPERPLSYHLASWRQQAEGTSTGQLIAAGTAPYTALKSAVDNRTSVASVPLGPAGTFTFPVPSQTVADRVKMLLELLVILSVFWRILGMLARAFGFEPDRGE